jgi:hypothetical protein
VVDKRSGVEQTLTEWAQHARIPKGTLFHRLKNGMTMTDAVALGRGRKGVRLSTTKAPAGLSRVKSPYCRAGAGNGADDTAKSGRTDGPGAAAKVQKKAPKSASAKKTPEDLASSAAGTAFQRRISVPGDGIEPPTRGFSIPCSTN